MTFEYIVYILENLTFLEKKENAEAEEELILNLNYICKTFFPFLSHFGCVSKFRKKLSRANEILSQNIYRYHETQTVLNLHSGLL
jgi:hypothetical protein